MSYIPNVGEKFLMDFPLTPALQEEYGTDSLIIEASYEGTLSSQEIEVQKAKGVLKEMYNILEFEDHHIVKFSDERWVNDFVGINSDDVSFKSVIGV